MIRESTKEVTKAARLSKNGEKKIHWSINEF